VIGPAAAPPPWKELGRFVEIQNLGLNLPFAFAFLWVAAQGLPSLRTILLVAVAFLAARNAGHGFNRYADRFWDAQTPRTRARPLVLSRSATAFTLAFVAANSAILIVAAYFLNPLALVLAPVALLLIFAYSYTKRVTSLTTAFLGLVEAITPAAAFIAVTGTLPLPAWIAIGAMLLWGTAFEMIHSLGDIESDRRLGLYSLPARFGRTRTLRTIPIVHGLALALFGLFGWAAHLSSPYYLGIAAMVAVTAWTDVTLLRAPEAPRGPFRRHFLLGAIFFIGTTMAVFLPFTI
jgi:4-hydroxybenzoate polyprenyltransferase